jgi:hypothetical protein
MRGRRNADTSRREVLQSDRDRMGRGALPAQMDAYTDSRSSDRMVSDCMAQRGWPQPRQEWWQRAGGGTIRL